MPRLRHGSEHGARRPDRCAGCSWLVGRSSSSTNNRRCRVRRPPRLRHNPLRPLRPSADPNGNKSIFNSRQQVFSAQVSSAIRWNSKTDAVWLPAVRTGETSSAVAMAETARTSSVSTPRRCVGPALLAVSDRLERVGVHRPVRLRGVWDCISTVDLIGHARLRTRRLESVVDLGEDADEGPVVDHRIQSGSGHAVVDACSVQGEESMMWSARPVPYAVG